MVRGRRVGDRDDPVRGAAAQGDRIRQSALAGGVEDGVHALRRQRLDPGDQALAVRCRQRTQLSQVAVNRTTRLRLQHPSVGLLELDSEVLLTPADDQRLVLLTAPAGTSTAASLELLRVVGPESFTE
ncbi:MmyB family transcriptional regulator [Paractinoplanes durhamensis]|uniref:MmyB-like transcription regulator ligand binding domain-containing protein n=1 Tax=Paractinoplanes durhamensis TaxID=113563 RepID=A0ABQ3YN54_9ACTN|nr:hypothetical protein [Actinoplanes durhamensis]GID99014.1 hypothetical protein Adu01nite_03650 [Actinoplanes durhamensis]